MKDLSERSGVNAAVQHDIMPNWYELMHQKNHKQDGFGAGTLQKGCAHAVVWCARQAQG